MTSNKEVAEKIERVNGVADRVGKYFSNYLKDFLFEELSDRYLEKVNMADILKDVPVPFRIKNIADGKMSNVQIGMDMAFVIGCDINFKYRDIYVQYIMRTFGEDFIKALLNEGIEAAAKGDFYYGCVCFRGAILIDPDSADALYCYGRACKDIYEKEDSEKNSELVGKFKAESLEAFEKVTLKNETFDMGYYFLGYAYLNLGLYIKAKLTWDSFLRLSKDENMRKEVEGWLEKLKEPVIIEEGYNMVLSGKYLKGLDILEKYVNDERYNTWWPLWYYMGVARKELGDYKEAESDFLNVLKYSPSNIESMKELVEVYKILGIDDKVKKYEDKIEVIYRNRADEMGRDEVVSDEK